MRSLFSLDEDNNVVIDPHALTLQPYAKIWNRDKSKSKSKAISELSYVYFMCDFKSYFSDITDQDQKHKEVSKVVFDGKGGEVDEVVKEAIVFYKKDIPLSIHLLEDAKIGLNELRRYFTKVDLLEETEKGSLKHDANKLSNNIIKLSQLIESLNVLEDKVKRDIDVNTKITGGREKGMFED